MWESRSGQLEREVIDQSKLSLCKFLKAEKEGILTLI